MRSHENVAEQNHWSECGRSTPGANTDALGRPHRSVLPLCCGNRMIENVLIGLLAILFCGSALMVWPICAVLWRNTGHHAKVLRWAFFMALACQLIVIGFFVFSHGLLEHQYYWCMVSILVNIVFTPIMIVAALYDHAKHTPSA